MDVTSCFSKRFRSARLASAFNASRLRRSPAFLDALATRAHAFSVLPPRWRRANERARSNAWRSAALSRASSFAIRVALADATPVSNARINRPRRSVGTTVSSTSSARFERAAFERNAPSAAASRCARCRRAAAASSDEGLGFRVRVGEEYSTPAMGVASRLTENIDSSSSSSSSRSLPFSPCWRSPDRTPSCASVSAPPPISRYTRSNTRSKTRDATFKVDARAAFTLRRLPEL